MTPGAAWFWGLLCVAVGSVPILQLAGYLPAPPDPPFFVFGCVGLVFGGGGVAVILQYGLANSAASRLAQILQYALSLVVTGAMTSIVGWIAFGPGERRFTFNLPFIPQQVGSILGRALFGVATAMMAGVFLLFAVVGASRLSKPE